MESNPQNQFYIKQPPQPPPPPPLSSSNNNNNNNSKPLDSNNGRTLLGTYL